MQHQPRRILARFGPVAASSDGVGIAVEGVDDRARIEKSARIAACAEGRVDHDVAGLDRQCGEHFVEQDRNVRGGTAHLRLASDSATSARQIACALSQPSPIS